MAIRKDILFTHVEDRYDIDIKNGDFVIGESDVQHIRHICEGEQGQYKQYPKLGLGIRKYLNGPVDGELQRRAMIMLRSDGYTPLRVRQVESGLVIRI